ncbi:hypothetical protein QCA50_008438 [Cerrena zonata]|uniref:Proline dehydrogenase n=1 Tax=Cerrena zonata TaxID=2478898 RepID=A0AAW0GDN1_9APHY
MSISLVFFYPQVRMLSPILRNSLVRSRPCLRQYRRQLSTHPNTSTRAPSISSKGIRWGLASGALLATSAVVVQATVHADAFDDDDKPPLRKPTPLSSLVRSYIVYTSFCIPGLVDWSPTILETLTSIPLVKQVTEAIVRITFFNQFVGGDTANDTLPVLETLHQENKGCLLAYSVEVDEAEAIKGVKKQGEVPVHKRGVQEMVRSIDVAADFEEQHRNASGNRSTWVAVKLTALLPSAQSLINFSKYILDTRQGSSIVPFPGAPRPSDLDILYSGSIEGSPLSQQDVVDLKNLYDDMARVCARGQERGIRVVIDAEYSWYQPAVDAIALGLMRKFNELPSGDSDSERTFQPLVYNTFQAYLRRQPAYLVQSIADAKAGNYALGIKLVRGAYHPHETSAHNLRNSGDGAKKRKSLAISSESEPPVWSNKADTDAAYNGSVELIMNEIENDVKGRLAPTQSSSRSWLSWLGLKKDTPVTAQPSPPRIGVLFGSHNWDSQKLILSQLVKRGLATVDGALENGDPIVRIGDEVLMRVSVAQLYGMTDALTNYIVDRTRSSSPFILKYVPYGALVEVMPYLSRRAIENKSVLGEGASDEERKLAAHEIKKRIFG